MAATDVNGNDARGASGSVGESRLTAKELKAAQAYVENGGNKSDAARTAGYSDPQGSATRIFDRVGVKAYIEEHSSHAAVRQRITHESIFDRHLHLISTKPTDYFDKNGDAISPEKLSVEAWSRVKGFKQTANGVELTFYDAAAINRDLAQWTKLLEAGSTSLGPEEAAAMIAAALVAAEELNSGEPE